VGLLLNGTGELVTNDVEKAKVISTFLPSLVFTRKIILQESETPETRGKTWTKEDLSSVEDDHVREHLNKLDMHKSMRPDTMHL